MIDFLWRNVDLKIAEQVRDYEAEENEAAYRHDGFLADGRFPESQRASLQVERSGAHRMRRTFGLLHLMTLEV